MNLGGNDIAGSCNPNAIFLDLMEIVDGLYRSGVERVFVASIIARGQFPSWTRMTNATFNKIRKSVNTKLKRRLKKDFVDIGSRLKYPRHYDKDLVHPGKKEGGLNVLKYEVLKTFRKTM